jgi:hypothetical protein
MSFLKSPSPICLDGINATLSLSTCEIVFKAKGNIHPLRTAKPQERLVALTQVTMVDHECHASGGNLVITLDDNSLIAIVYAERDHNQAQLLHQYLIAYLNNRKSTASVG